MEPGQFEQLLEDVIVLVEEQGFAVEKTSADPGGISVTCREVGRKPTQFELWLRPDDGKSPCYDRCHGWMIGHAGTLLSQHSKELLESLLSHLPQRTATSDASSVNPALTYGNDQLEIRLTLKCNLHCVFCNSWFDAQNAVDRMDDAIGRLAMARSSGATRLVITGGEPLLVPWIPEVIQTARDMGFRYVTVQTNATLLTDTDVLTRIRRAGPDELLISLHAATAPLTAVLTGKDSYEAAIAGTLLALSSPFRVSVNHVVCRQNLTFLKEFVQLMADLPGIAAAPVSDSPDHSIRTALPEPVASSGTRPPDSASGVLNQRVRPDLLAFSVVAPTGLAWENRNDTLVRYSDAAHPLLEALRMAASMGLPVVHSEYCGIPTCIQPALREYTEPSQPGRPIDVPPDKIKLPLCTGCHWNKRCSGIFRRYLEMFGDKEFSLGNA